VHFRAWQVNYGMGAANPLDKVRFFEHWPDTTSFHIDSATQNSMMPQAYQVRLLRTQILSRSSCRNASCWGLGVGCQTLHDVCISTLLCQADWSGHAAATPSQIGRFV